jgi:hypothetical protein
MESAVGREVHQGLLLGADCTVLTVLVEWAVQELSWFFRVVVAPAK